MADPSELYALVNRGGTPGVANSGVNESYQLSRLTSDLGLSSTSNGEGASLIGIEDAAGNITATTVEGALAEVATKLPNISGQTEETDPADADLFLMQRASDGEYRKIQASNLPGSGGGGASYAHNLILNGEFNVDRRNNLFPMTSATDPANDDGVYTLARWILVSDGDDIVDLHKESTKGRTASAAAAIKLEVETANKKFGLFQIIQWQDARRLMNKVCSVSFLAQTTTGAQIENIRCAILKSTTTDKDDPARDPISAWGAEGANPTLVADWEYVNTPADMAVTVDAWGEHKVENQTITADGEGGSNANNIGLLIWVDDTDAAVDDVLYITKVQLHEGATAQPFQGRSYSEEIRLCSLFYNVFGYGMNGFASTTGRAQLAAPFVNRMVKTPNLVLVDDSPTITTPSGNVTGSSATLVSTNVDQKGFRVTIDGFSGLTAGDPVQSNQGSDLIEADAEIGT